MGVVMIMLLTLLLYWLTAQAYFIHLSTVNENNETFVFRWLFEAASKETQKAFRTHGGDYYKFISEVGILEKKAIDLLYLYILKLPFKELCDEMAVPRDVETSRRERADRGGRGAAAPAAHRADALQPLRLACPFHGFHDAMG
jgi:hypothetical protein